jgi:hypothetical protein
MTIRDTLRAEVSVLKLSLVSSLGVATAIAGCAPTVRTFEGVGGGETSSSSTATSSSSTTSSSTTSTTSSSTTSTTSSSGVSSSSSGGGPKTATYPVAPSAGNFMWQGVQDQFLDQDSQPCKARVTIAAGDQATCFVGANGNLYCAGQIDVTNYGSKFVDTGVAGVEQILMSPTFNAANHNSICVVRSNKGGECWGSDNDQGQFADGNKNASPLPVSWGGILDMHRLATGTWDSICGLTNSGKAYCAGYSFGATAIASPGIHQNLFVDTFGMINTDSTTVLRVPNSRAECKIGADGYECGGTTPYGMPGTVVDGTVQGGGASGRACWLSSDGKVTCTPWSPGMPGPPIFGSMFTAMPVLAISGNFYSDDICGVYSDGSIACMGKNAHGELGTGDTAPVGAEKIVAPPGTIDVTCK